MNRRIKTISISGILVFLLTVFLFFMVIQERIMIKWIYFIFILLAEIILFGGLMLIEAYSTKTSQLIWRIGGGASILAYSVISIFISLIYMLVPLNYSNSFLILQAILLVIAAIAIIVFYTTGNSIKESDDKVLDSINRLNNIIDRLDLIRKDVKNAEYSLLLRKAYEELKYSDTSTFVPSDSELELQVVKLEVELMRDDENKNNLITGMIQDILMLISRRKLEVKNTKVGGI